VRNLVETTAWFSTQDDCLDYLECFRSSANVTIQHGAMISDCRLAAESTATDAVTGD
jgi:hypothetical protein